MRDMAKVRQQLDEVRYALHFIEHSPDLTHEEMDALLGDGNFMRLKGRERRAMKLLNYVPDRGHDSPHMKDLRAQSVRQGFAKGGY